MGQTRGEDIEFVQIVGEKDAEAREPIKAVVEKAEEEVTSSVRNANIPGSLEREMRDQPCALGVIQKV